MKLRSKKGFSLVELIIVIAILGIIAVIAVPNLTNVQKSSQLNADIRTAEQIGKAVRIWLTDADALTIASRESAISNYIALNDTKLGSGTGGVGLNNYISQDYKPVAYSGDFYIKLDSFKIKVVVASSASDVATAASATYKLENGVASAGLAYAEK